jgi:hypothetical protein
VYWLKVYGLISAVIFAMAGLFIFVSFIAFKVKAWFSVELGQLKQLPAIGIPVALPNASANLEVQTNE